MRRAVQIAAAVHDQARHTGLAPLVPLNEASVVSVPLPWASSKTVPSPEAPPADVVPYRLPLLSMIRAACGVTPSGR